MFYFFCHLQSGILSIVGNSSLSCPETFGFEPLCHCVTDMKGERWGDVGDDDDTKTVKAAEIKLMVRMIEFEEGGICGRHQIGCMR